MMIASKHLICLAIVGIFFFQSISMISANVTQSPTDTVLTPSNDQASIQTTPTYQNSDIANLWVRKNGSDPGFPFGGANVTPSYGMNYFGTNMVQATWDYSLTEITTTNLFPANSLIYVQQSIGGNVNNEWAFAAAVADTAVTDTRIRGIFIDDFPVANIADWELAGIYTALRHEDAQHPAYHLKIILIVYQYNYMHEYPVTWSAMSPYFDIVEFWFYPRSYQLLYREFAGFLDDFNQMRDLIPGKEYWIGIYLHYYNNDHYPYIFSSTQISTALKLIKEEKATRVSILENFWIQHNPDTALIVKNALTEYKADYHNFWFSPETHRTYRNAEHTIVTYNTTANETVSGFDATVMTFDSLKFQNLSIVAPYADLTVDATLVAVDLITGDYTRAQWDDYNETYDCGIASFFIEANRGYRLFNVALIQHSYDGEYWVNSPENWTSGVYYINGTLQVNSSLTIHKAIIQFGYNHYIDNVYNGTKPTFGLKIRPNDAVWLFISVSVITGLNKAYPYLFERPRNTEIGINQHVGIFQSVLACYWGTFWPAGVFSIEQSTIYETQPDNGTYHISLRIETPIYNSATPAITIDDLLIWNYPDFNTIGLFILPGTIPEIEHIHIDGLRIIGGQYAIWFDGSYSNNGLVIRNFAADYLNKETQHGSNWGMFYCVFKIDGNSPNVGMQVWSESMWSWSIEASTPLAKGMIDFVRTDLPEGIYELDKDGMIYRFAVLNGNLSVSYSGPWNVYRTNFTITYFGQSIADQSMTITNVMWLLFLFLPVLAITQAVPKIGFIFGMVLMLIVLSFSDTNFVPFMFIGLLTIGVATYKGVM